MQDYKQNLKDWAKFALAKDEVSWNRNNLSPEEMAEMLAVLAGYLGATKQGREILEDWV
jgi:pyridoxal/pyridoxine/pyridoxamine kinase